MIRPAHAQKRISLRTLDLTLRADVILGRLTNNDLDD
jgi:hypothetical protein